MSETLSQHGTPMSQTFFGPSKLLGHLGHISAAEILEFATFEQIPDSFLRIEFGRIARQALQMEPFGRPALQKGFDHVRPMDRRAIPNHQQLARDSA